MFHFKHFSVSHDRSAMKVGVDGVLIGCWADISGVKKILDVGTGCGVIALIMAQRCQNAFISGIDIDVPSIEEATENVKNSSWKDRIVIKKASFPCDVLDKCNSYSGYDLVISNPPYFNSGIAEASTPREKARHQGVLSPSSILLHSRQILNEGGSVAMVIPLEEIDRLENEASSLGYSLIRKCLVRGHEKVHWKRGLLQWRYYGKEVPYETSLQELTLEITPGVPTEEYRTLCKDFYMKF